MNTKKERLIELLQKHCVLRQDVLDCTNRKTDDCSECLADYLLENRVDIPLCKPGDVLYSIVDCTNHPEKIYVTGVHMHEKYDSITALSKGQREYVFKDKDFGEVVFYTENEALEALNKRRKTNG